MLTHDREFTKVSCFSFELTKDLQMQKTYRYKRKQEEKTNN